jgi:hypothetical protein
MTQQHQELEVVNLGDNNKNIRQPSDTSVKLTEECVTQFGKLNIILLVLVIFSSK